MITEETVIGLFGPFDPVTAEYYVSTLSRDLYGGDRRLAMVSYKDNTPNFYRWLCCSLERREGVYEEPWL